MIQSFINSVCYLQEPIGSVDLRQCITDEFKNVRRDRCSRNNTFLLAISRPSMPADFNNLVTERKGHETIIRYHCKILLTFFFFTYRVKSPEFSHRVLFFSVICLVQTQRRRCSIGVSSLVELFQTFVPGTQQH